MIATLWDRNGQSRRRQIEDEERPLIGRRDARIRIIATLTLIIAILAIDNPAIIALLAISTSLFARATGLTFLEQQRRLIHIEGFMIALLILLPITIPGEPLATFGALTITSQGVSRALIVAGKVLTASLIIYTMIGSLEPVRLARALATFGAPPNLIQLLLLAIRYVAVLRSESGRLREAMRARGFKPSTNMHTITTFASLIGMSLVRSLERAERVHEAMRCRAFSGSFPLRNPKPLQTADFQFAAATLAVAIVFILVSVHS